MVLTHIGDIITAVDGHPIRQIDDIINYIESHKNVGDTIKLTVNRDGKIMDLTATLQARPQTPPSQAQAWIRTNTRITADSRISTASTIGKPIKLN